MFCVDPVTAKANEARRLATIADYEIEANSSEPEFEHIVELAAAMFGVPISLISIVEQERQFFAARVGLEASSTARDISFCTHALERDEALVVEDALLDPRFADNPLVLGPPYIRFYAGAPLRVASGDVLGTLCIISPEPRKFEPELARILESLARIVVDRLELRRSERRRRDNEERLVHLAHVDQLTGLPNRALFQERATAMLKTVRGRAPGGALLLFDLDGFKDVNDVLGHVIGDRLLAAVGERLSKCTEAGQLLARLGGDEFVLLVPGVGDPRAAHRIATDMCGCFRDPFKVDGEELQLDTSIGIAIAPHHGTSVEGLLVSADLALYHAKDQGGGSIGFFEPHLRHQVEARQRMQGELRHAFECGEFELLFQPQVSLPDRRIVGAEALLRWRHPVHGLLAPVQFLAVLERMPLSINVGSWVVRTAIAQAAAWLAIGHPLRVGINLFAAQFRPGNLAELVRGELARHGLPSRLIEIEVTESTAIKDSERVIAEARRPSAARCRHRARRLRDRLCVAQSAQGNAAQSSQDRQGICTRDGAGVLRRRGC